MKNASLRPIRIQHVPPILRLAPKGWYYVSSTDSWRKEGK